MRYQDKNYKEELKNLLDSFELEAVKELEQEDNISLMEYYDILEQLATDIAIVMRKEERREYEDNIVWDSFRVYETKHYYILIN